METIENLVSNAEAWRVVAWRLSLVAELTQEETAFLQNCDIAVRSFSEGEDVFVEGDTQSNIYVCLEGWGARYRVLIEGQRQVVDFILPGSIFGAQVDEYGQHSISAGALNNMTLAVVSETCLRQIAKDYANVASRIAIALADESVRLLERVISLGRRDAEQRLGHLLLELNERLEAFGEAQEMTVRLPVSQKEVADFLGLTSVHVSRTLGQMRDKGLIDYDNEYVTIRKGEELAELSEYESEQVNTSAIPLQLQRVLLNCGS
ncbi:MAG: Crp/Fnr family transcriptional regulator [Kiloniellales bacterium]|nr:Crp/Fnr family transcriptional regulator [Kiloniellales bacterium]